MAVIEAAELVKEFSRPAVLEGRLPRLRALFSTKRDINRAVNGVNFEVEPGELVGYLGPNGAGKSTTIKMLTGILTPTSGVCRVAGLEPSRDRARNARNIGVVFGQRTQLWYDLPLRDSFEVLADLYNLDRTTYRNRVGLFTELLDLSDFLDTPVRSLSLGQRMRGDLVAAMLHEPSILFLDEPTVGLDVVAKARLTEFIAETNRSAGTTVVLTTHDMEDVERLCHRIIVIDSGTVLYDGDLSRLKERFMPYRFLVLTLAERSIRRVADIPFATEVETSAVGTVLPYPDRSVVLRFDPREITTPELIARASQVYQVDELSIVDPRLTDVISQLYDGLLT
ncbi:MULTISPECIES: ATP-binding cassette domain-containing protein [Kribbella]|jgi:ABC-2 type transport system ATP-binding protein|uniref:ABC-2 type transport system ATP-binding protein n=1 Tax=Kribbella pratensis TaxID=2512112 RepID=A0ABY2FEL4_9ACTN|nr:MULTISPECIES: ATP-binding cassette domain-containing protein [Kribbella]TDW89807.1 ABC-2 type transport system ATP-binding protein [Kribbella pratensis]TDX08869.1 ABC-2 type transport system ATP-binding protein [Kribbella sp. VKM Ac-2566]